MPESKIEFYEKSESFNSKSRIEIREELTKEFIKEKAGLGSLELSSKYTYYVERINDLYITLKRPARLNKGYDFEVNVEGLNFKNKRNQNTTRPSHSNIVNDLKDKMDENLDEYRKLYNLIESIYNCNYSESMLINLSFESGYPFELTMKIIKWLFIEQDITYWNFSGRRFLWEMIPKPE